MNNQSISRFFEKIKKQRALTSIAAFAVLFIVLAFIANNFLTTGNWTNIVKQTAVVGVTAVGMTLVIITGGIDLSVGSINAFCCVICASVLSSYGTAANALGPIVLAIAASLLAGVLLGSVNGILVSLVKLPPFIVTLGMMGIARGMALLYTDGASISIREATDFRVISDGNLLGIPIPGVIMLAMFILGWILLNKIRLGYYIFAVGGNVEASRLSGINVNFVTYMVYAIEGLCTAIGAVILTGRLGAGQPIAGDGLEMDAIAAVVIGGTSLAGGIGSMFGTLVGAFVSILIKNGLNLLNINAYWQQIAVGVAVVFAVAIDITLSRRRKS